jgi:hypothetical protein
MILHMNVQCLPTSNTRVRRPRPSKHNIMLVVVEISCCHVSQSLSTTRITDQSIAFQVTHRYTRDRVSSARTRPASPALSWSIPIGHRHWVPVFESDVRLIETNEEFVWVRTSCSAGGAVEGRLGWRRLLDTIVHEMSVDGSAWISLFLTTEHRTYPLTAGIVFSRFCESSFFFKPSV